MRLMDHQNVVSLRHCFFSTTSRDELFQRMPLVYVKLYTYQGTSIYSYCTRSLPQGCKASKSFDIWSAGCVLAELLLGQNQVDLLVEIIKVLGTPTREEIRCMNPNYTDFRFPQIKAHPWHKIFHKRMPPEAIDLASRLLQYLPSLRCSALAGAAPELINRLIPEHLRRQTGLGFSHPAGI
ncbi:hypothetical protein TanjilG_11079 [Lupinus angustifolius]|uniref:Non-specific serine/threonine protein kinase n=1 Tax=Lupinus angustifolius TaxID=3871 RepID=A0A1J7GGJ2_LUPAN|nr:hypothetical protein TanjilG_11079 [Lupinus angustifolius]